MTGPIKGIFAHNCMSLQEVCLPILSQIVNFLDLFKITSRSTLIKFSYFAIYLQTAEASFLTGDCRNSAFNVLILIVIVKILKYYCFNYRMAEHRSISLVHLYYVSK